MPSLHYQCLTTTQDEIRGLDLTGIVDDDVRVLSVPTTRSADVATSGRKVKYPCIFLAPFGTEELPEAETSTNDLVFPVLVVILDAANQEQTKNLDRWLQWRQDIFDHFHENAFAAISGSHRSTVQPLAIIDSQKWRDDNLFVSGLVINHQVTKQRRAA
jgi:hypothetical protein